jgi:hypothetical protein
MAEEAKPAEAPQPEAKVDAKIEKPADQPKALPKSVKKYPAKIRLTRPFGFIDDLGHTHYWFQNLVVDAPIEIMMIIDRGCKDFVAI